MIKLIDITNGIDDLDMFTEGNVFINKHKSHGTNIRTREIITNRGNENGGEYLQTLARVLSMSGWENRKYVYRIEREENAWVLKEEFSFGAYYRYKEDEEADRLKLMGARKAA